MGVRKMERTGKMLALGFIADRAILGEDDALETLEGIFRELAGETKQMRERKVRMESVLSGATERWRDVVTAIAAYTLREVQGPRC